MKEREREEREGVNKGMETMRTKKGDKKVQKKK